ncbi:GH3 auxin-responsive promoter family protein, partial [Candidatus Bathyarchaeota archaeon]|nr:GH3 auxin-responsive promoter family protein [Candidatus Bathyarchaeota archaeon]
MVEDKLGLQNIVGPWYESLKNPEKSQEQLLPALVGAYGKTRYGRSHRADEVEDIGDFRRRFPIMDYRMLSPYLSDVMRGDYESVLPEPLVCWVMTRGSTGAAKVLPTTKTHLEQVFTCGARALVNYVTGKQDTEILTGKVLNLNLPSNVHRLGVDGRDMSYGYSSGTYAKLNPAFKMFGLTPKQEEIDALGPGIKKTDWERRFELVYQKALDENVTSTIGVTPVIQSFGRYVERRHGKKPKKLWKMHALFCTSVANI